MNKITLGLIVFSSAASLALAGTEYSGKEIRQSAVQTQECFYGDTEVDVSLWGTYAFAGTDQGHIGAPGFFFGDDRGDRQYGLSAIRQGSSFLGHSCDRCGGDVRRLPSRIPRATS